MLASAHCRRKKYVQLMLSKCRHQPVKSNATQQIPVCQDGDSHHRTPLGQIKLTKSILWSGDNLANTAVTLGQEVQLPLRVDAQT